MSMTAIADKPKTKKPAAGHGTFAEDGSADLFVVHEFGFIPAAEAWLKKRGVRENEMGLYTGVIDTHDDKSIRLPEWQRRVRNVVKEFIAAGILACADYCEGKVQS